MWTCGRSDGTFLFSFAMLFLIIAASCSTSEYRLFSCCTFAWRSIGCRWCSSLHVVWLHIILSPGFYLLLASLFEFWIFRHEMKLAYIPFSPKHDYQNDRLYFFCFSIFAELCESSQKTSAGALVQKFLELNQKMQSAAMAVDALQNLRLPGTDSSSCYPPQHFSPDARKDPASKNAASWVKAAIATSLSAFDLYRKQKNDEIPNGERFHYVVLENSPAEDFENRALARKQNKRNNGTLLTDSTTKGSPPASGRPSSAARRSSTEKEDSSKGNRLKEAASLAEKLLLASREWFLKYLDDSLNVGFGLKREERSPEIASLLGQHKRVNHWLDELASNGAREDKRIEGLKKKLYGFLLEHMLMLQLLRISKVEAYRNTNRNGGVGYNSRVLTFRIQLGIHVQRRFKKSNSTTKNVTM